MVPLSLWSREATSDSYEAVSSCTADYWLRWLTLLDRGGKYKHDYLVAIWGQEGTSDRKESSQNPSEFHSLVHAFFFFIYKSHDTECLLCLYNISAWQPTLTLWGYFCRDI